MFDIAESQLRVQASRGNMTAVAIVVNNSPEAKKRGWGPRQEIVGKDGEPITVKVLRGVSMDEV